jgi:ResB-like family
MLHRCLNFFTSLRLTVVCLSLAIILVFVGTLAEVNMGLYQAQSEIFRSFFVYWTPPGAHWRIPVFPGGWLIGLTLLVNLIAAHIKRFRFEKKKIGILLIHGGLILLLLGQFLTELYQVESQMRIPVGESRNFSEDSRKHELAIIDVTDPKHQNVVTIPETLLVQGGEIHPPGLPFSIRANKFYENSFPVGPMGAGNGESLKATQGIGQRLLFLPAAEAKSMDDENVPSALVEVIANGTSLGEWTTSLWFTAPPLVAKLQANAGDLMKISFADPQTFSLGGHTYELALRSTRYYQTFTIGMLEFKHDLYLGTEVEKNFSSKIHLSDPAHGEDRDVLIHMNAPLRYNGLTFYQAAFERGDKVSILQVVRNPAAITPYLACSLVALGLLVQFLTHLIGFGRKQAQKVKAASRPTQPAAPVLKPALAERRTKA